VADVTSPHHLGDRPDGLLDRDGGIEPAQAVDVDMIGPEPTERIREGALDGRRAPVDPDDGAVGARRSPNLDADRDLIAVTPFERPADKQLVVPRPVVIAGVEQRDAGVERGVDGGDALGLVGRTVEVRYPCSRGRWPTPEGPVEPSVR
jgi:hypothetical protein